MRAPAHRGRSGPRSPACVCRRPASRSSKFCHGRASLQGALRGTGDQLAGAAQPRACGSSRRVLSYSFRCFLPTRCTSRRRNRTGRRIHPACMMPRHTLPDSSSIPRNLLRNRSRSSRCSTDVPERRTSCPRTSPSRRRATSRSSHRDPRSARRRAPHPGRLPGRTPRFQAPKFSKSFARKSSFVTSVLPPGFNPETAPLLPERTRCKCAPLDDRAMRRGVSNAVRVLASLAAGVELLLAQRRGTGSARGWTISNSIVRSPKACPGSCAGTIHDVPDGVSTFAVGPTAVYRAAGLRVYKLAKPL